MREFGKSSLVLMDSLWYLGQWTVDKDCTSNGIFMRHFTTVGYGS